MRSKYTFIYGKTHATVLEYYRRLHVVKSKRAWNNPLCFYKWPGRSFLLMNRNFYASTKLGQTAHILGTDLQRNQALGIK